MIDRDMLCQFCAGLCDSSPATLVTLATLCLLLPKDGLIFDILNSLIFVECLSLSYNYFHQPHDDLYEWLQGAIVAKIATVQQPIDITTAYNNPAILIAPIMSSWHALDGITTRRLPLTDRITYFWGNPAYFTGFGFIGAIARTTLVYHVPYLRLSVLIGSIHFTNIGSQFFLPHRRVNRGWPI